jgi:transcriptional regulator with XRE-family HTH domain
MKMLCAECGKRAVEPLAVAGRHSPFRNFEALEVPADLEIPTCTHCGAEWIDRKTAERIDAALEEEAAATLGRMAREAIEILGLTMNQRELEVQLGLSHGYLSKVKHGKEAPSSQLVAVLALLAVSPRRLDEVERMWTTGQLPPRITADHVNRGETRMESDSAAPLAVAY